MIGWSLTTVIALLIAKKIDRSILMVLWGISSLDEIRLADLNTMLQLFIYAFLALKIFHLTWNCGHRCHTWYSVYLVLCWVIVLLSSRWWYGRMLVVPEVKLLVTTKSILHEKWLGFANRWQAIETKVRRPDTYACIVSSFVEKILRATSSTKWTSSYLNWQWTIKRRLIRRAILSLR